MVDFQDGYDRGERMELCGGAAGEGFDASFRVCVPGIQRLERGFLDANGEDARSSWTASRRIDRLHPAVENDGIQSLGNVRVIEFVEGSQANLVENRRAMIGNSEPGCCLCEVER